MVKKNKLQAFSREEKQKESKKLRRSGFVPAVLYGSGSKNINLKVKRQDIEKMYAHNDVSGLIDLSIDGAEPVKTIIKDEQRDSLKDKLVHLDFYKVNMKNKIDVEVQLHFINESKAVRELGGVLIKNLETLEVKCLPSEMLEKIDIDLSALVTLDDHIRVGDLKLPEGIEVANHAEDVIAHVIEPKVVEEEVTPIETTETPAAETKASEENDGDKK